MAAVAGDQQVVGLHRGDGADGGGLLAGGEVAVAADPGGLVLALGGFLEAADQDHLAVEVEQVGGRGAAVRVLGHGG